MDDDARATHLREFQTQLEDEDAHRHRIRACETLADALTKTGKVVWSGSWISRDESTEALGLVVEMAAELALGAVALFSQELWYAGAALLRQIVETEYLLHLLVQGADASANWMTASPEQLRSWFSPSAMRRRSGGAFRDQEYWTHCEHGGHPHPKARLLLKDHSSRLGSMRWLWVDLAQHLERFWHNLLPALTVREANAFISDEVRAHVETALANWRERDQLASHAPLRPE